MENQPDFHLISGRASNFYLCQDEEGLVLIDAGLPREQDRLWRVLDQLGHQPSDLRHILVTHADIDHVGSLAVIQSLSGATIFTGAATRDYIVGGESPKHLPWPGNLISRLFLRYKPVPAGAVQPVAEGDVLPFLGGIRVLATPGHTLDHHSFYCPAKGLLFAGDALSTRGGSLQPPPSRVAADPEASRHSAIRLLEIAPAFFACGHGPPSSDHSSDSLMELFNQLRRADA